MDLQLDDAASPAGRALLERQLGAAALADHLARPRARPGFAIVAAGRGGRQGQLLMAHERRRLGAASLNLGQIVALRLSDPADDELRAGLLAAAARAAGEAGLMWLRLHGPAAIYGPLGLAPAALQHTLLLPRPPGGAGGGLRRAGLSDSDDLAALQAASDAAAPLSPLRAAPDWRALIDGADLWVCEDRLGRAAGYLWLVAGRVVEAAAADAGAARELLAALGATGPGGLRLDLPVEYGVGRAALQLGAAAQLWAPAASEPTWLWGVVDLGGALDELRPELAGRLGRSRYAGWAGQLQIAGESSGATLRAAAGELRVAEGGGPADVALRRVSLGGMAQLLLGYRAAADLRATGDLRCADSDLGLIDALFPQLP